MPFYSTLEVRKNDQISQMGGKDKYKYKYKRQNLKKNMCIYIYICKLKRNIEMYIDKNIDIGMEGKRYVQIQQYIKGRTSMKKMKKLYRYVY